LSLFYFGILHKYLIITKHVYFDQQNRQTFFLQPDELRICNTPVDASTLRPIPVVVETAPVTSTRPYYAVAATGPSVATTSAGGEDENLPDINAQSNNNPDSLKEYHEIFNKVLF